VNKQHNESAPDDRVLTISRTFAAPRSLVFRAWIEPQHLARWWGPRGYTLPSCEMNAHPGGSYRFLMRSGEGREVWWHGVCREIVEPERLVWTCAIHDAEGNLVSAETVLTITLEEENGATRLTLHQAVFGTLDNRNAHNRGWADALDRLGELVAQA
jgi:uncharacterized protein YndB with AHSA1/START domain